MPGDAPNPNPRPRGGARPGASDFVIAGVPHPESMQLLIDRERDRERGRVSGGGGTTGVPGTGV